MDFHHNSSSIGQACAPLLEETHVPFDPFQSSSAVSSSICNSATEGTEHLNISNPHTLGRAECGKVEYVPISAPPDYPALDFRPTIIRRTVSIPFCIAYLAISGCLFFGYFFNYLGEETEGGWKLSDVNTYLATHFIPPAVGTITTIHIKSTSQTLRRMLPYMAMADRGQKREGAPLGRSIKARYFPTLLPNSFTTWVILGIILAVEFVVPLKSSLAIMVPKNPDATKSTDVSGGGWTLYFDPSIALLLGLIYAGLALFMLTFIVFGPGQQSTGLKADWDPVSLSDFVALFHPLSATQDQQTEHSPLTNAHSLKDTNPRLRLGYWQLVSSTGSKDGITYGIRDLHAPTIDISRLDHSRHNFHRHRMTFGKIHSSMAVLLLVAVSTYWVWICIRRHNLPVYHWPSSYSTYESSISKMYASPYGAYLAVRTISVYLANLIRILISTLDIHYRWVQPFADMRDGPNTAPKTILLDYLTISPLEVIPMSWHNKHWKVFSVSVAACSSWILPLLAAGALYGATEPATENSANSMGLLRVSMVFLVSAMVFSGIYLILVLICWPTAKRASPRNSGCLADWYKLFYASHLRRAPEFLQAASGRDMTKEDLNASLFLKKDKYMFGTCVDTRGSSYIGFDVAEKGGVSTGFVTKLRKETTGLKRKSTGRGIELEEMGLVGK